MAVRKIVIYPDQRLRRTAKPVANVDAEVQQLLDDMVETMYHAEGIGLAATQVGVNQRVLVMDVDREAEERNPICMINPELVTTSDDEETHNEGCLSIPEIEEEVTRPRAATVRYLDRDGQPQEQAFEELAARCVQHEVDHLNGRLFIDHLGPMKRRQIDKLMTRRKLDAKRKGGKRRPVEDR